MKTLFTSILTLVLFTAYAQKHILTTNEQTQHVDHEVMDSRLLQLKSSNFLQSAPNVLVLLIDFEDEPADISTEEMDDYFNSRTIDSHPSTGGFKDYWSKNSYGAFEPNCTIAGWYRAKHSYQHYRDMPLADAADSLFLEAMAAASTDDSIDLSIFDNDEDGRSEGVVFVTSRIIRAQARFKVSASYNNVVFSSYSISSMHSANFDSGTTIHEYGHILGLPDLYLTNEPIGFYDVMSHSKADPPGNLSAWCKHRLGWIDLLVIEEPMEQVEIPESNTNPIAIKIFSEPYWDGQYFLIENRKSTGYDANYFSSNGLLIYHVDDHGNNEFIRVLQADGKDDMRTYYESNSQSGNLGDAGDFFPGSENVRRLDANTYPSTLSFKSENHGVVISNISDAGDLMYADISPTTERKGILKINPDLTNIFYESSSGVPIARTTQDSIWGGDYYDASEWNQLDGMTYYYRGPYTYPQDQYDTHKVNLRLYHSINPFSLKPEGLFYEGRFDVDLPDVDEIYHGFPLYIGSRAEIIFDEPIAVPETFFAAYCPIANVNRPLVGNQIYKGNVSEEINLPDGYESYFSFGSDFPTFYARRNSYLTLHFYASDQRQTTGILSGASASQIGIFPNPATDQLSINITDSEVKGIRIYDVLGKVVYVYNNFDNQGDVSLTNLTEGIYFLVFTNKDQVPLYSKKLVKK